MSTEVVGPSVVGQPVVYVSLLAVLVLLAFARPWVESLVTVAHEGGHMAMAVLTGRSVEWFNIDENRGGQSSGATLTSGYPGVSNVLVALVGYLTPPLVGLGAAGLVLDGRAWSVLWAAVVLLFAAFLKAKDLFTIVVVVLLGAGIGWVAVQGSAGLQAGIAVGLVWIMLLGGITTMEGQGLGTGSSDAAQLAKETWIPAVLWVALFWFVAIISLWVGGRRLLGL